MLTVVGEGAAESASTEEVLMDFADAMRAVQDGLSVHRNCWSDREARVQRVNGYLSIFMGGQWKPWIVQDEDITAKDWEV